jgi:hypothetical protein
MAGFELLIREQDWTKVSGGATNADVICSLFA